MAVLGASAGVASGVLVPAWAKDDHNLGWVQLRVGDDFQAAVDRHPAGTRFLIKRGVHRMQQVIPKDGNWFRGEPGAVLNGSRILRPTDFERDGSGLYYVGGQTQQGSPYGSPTGNLNNEHPEEVFVNGYTRLIHVGSLAELTTGAFFFDYDTDRIYLYDDPTSFSLIETSVCLGAFSGTAVRNVRIDNLIVEKYASAQFGAIGFGDAPKGLLEWFTYNWTVTNCEVRYNHGDGIYVGPGMVVENCNVHNNGKSGIAGQSYNAGRGATNPEFLYTDLVTVRNCYIHDNNLGFYGSGSEGGAGKYSGMKHGMVFENNWVYNNVSDGPWYDVGTQMDPGCSVEFRSNLIDSNTGNGIAYEICYGPCNIYWNEFRNNDPTATFTASLSGAGVYLSNSSDINVYQNWIHGNGGGVTGTSGANRVPVAANIAVYDNDISAITTIQAGIAASSGDNPYAPDRMVTFTNNVYRGDPDATAWYWAGARRTFADWQSFGLDTAGRVLPAGSMGRLPRGAKPFKRCHYGPK